MMHERVRQRLEVLEARALANAPVQIVHINFVGADKVRVEPTVARGRDFECFRLAGEDLDAFRARASLEARATAPPGPMVLIFPEEETSRAT
jgi:hypothetical protein